MQMPSHSIPILRTNYWTGTAVNNMGLESEWDNELALTNSRFELYWQASPDPTVIGYNIYEGHSSRIYFTNYFVTGTSWPPAPPPISLKLLVTPITGSQLATPLVTNPPGVTFYQLTGSNGVLSLWQSGQYNGPWNFLSALATNATNHWRGAKASITM